MESCYGIYGAQEIVSKAHAVAYVMQYCCTWSEKTKRCSFDLKKAQKLLDFINKNANLPEVKKDPTDNLAGIYDILIPLIKNLAEKKEAATA